MQGLLTLLAAWTAPPWPSFPPNAPPSFPPGVACEYQLDSYLLTATNRHVPVTYRDFDASHQDFFRNVYNTTAEVSAFHTYCQLICMADLTTATLFVTLSLHRRVAWSQTACRLLGSQHVLPNEA